MKKLPPHQIHTLSEQEKASILTLMNRLNEQFHLHQTILFGSKSRGDFDQWSDVDLLVVVEEEKNWFNREKLSDITFDVNLEFDTQLSCILESTQAWMNRTEQDWHPLRNVIDQEGINLVQE